MAGGGDNNIGPGSWANGAHIGAPPGIHAGPNGSMDYINRLLQFGHAPTIPDTFSSTTDNSHGSGHGKGDSGWKTGVVAGTAGLLALAYLVGKGRLKAAGQQGTSLIQQLKSAVRRPPSTSARP